MTLKKPKMSKEKLVMLGVGQTALAVVQLAQNYNLYGTTRNSDKIEALRKAGIKDIFIPKDLTVNTQKELSSALENAKVLVSFPPNDYSDKLFSSLCKKNSDIIYISATSVYGNYNGTVDESSPVDQENPRSKKRLQAEKAWLDRGAIILRAPALYGPESGLHLRLLNGTYRLPQEHNNYISRIHLTDLSRIILASFAKPLEPGSIYLVSDKYPATQIEVVKWLCQEMNIPMPSLAESSEAPVSLTASRRINSQKILSELNLQLLFPTYKEGYSHCLQNLKKSMPSITSNKSNDN